MMYHLLIVDDDPVVLKSLVRSLAATYTCNTARNGVEAIQKLDTRSSSLPYDLIISDVDMPFMTGIDLYRWVAATYPEDSHKVVFYTGSDVPKLDELGVPVIRKGDSLQQTLDAIAMFVSRGVAQLRDFVARSSS